MRFWILAIFAIALQETFITSGVLARGYQLDPKNLIYLGLIFITTTSFNIVFWFNVIGKLRSNKEVTNYIESSRVYLWISQNSMYKRLLKQRDSITEQAEAYVGSREKKLFLATLSLGIPAWACAMIAPWFNLRFRVVFPIVLIGSSVWFSIIVLIVLGVNHFIENAALAMMIVLVIVLALVILHKRLANKHKPK